jgi:hypothetical protein
VPWALHRPEALRRYQIGDWAGLGTLVMQIGWQDDLSYFYLGRAAEGMGAYQASRKYYQIAVALAEMDAACHSVLYNNCDGFSFPTDIYPRLQFVEAAIAQSEAAAASPPPIASAAPPETPVRSASRVRHATQPPKFGEPMPARSPSQPIKAPSAASEEDQWVRPPPITR